MSIDLTIRATLILWGMFGATCHRLVFTHNYSEKEYSTLFQSLRVPNLSSRKLMHCATWRVQGTGTMPSAAIGQRCSFDRSQQTTLSWSRLVPLCSIGPLAASTRRVPPAYGRWHGGIQKATDLGLYGTLRENALCHQLNSGKIKLQHDYLSTFSKTLVYFPSRVSSWQCEVVCETSDVLFAFRFVWFSLERAWSRQVGQ